jgi:hypothetical protein
MKVVTYVRWYRWALQIMLAPMVPSNVGLQVIVLVFWPTSSWANFSSAYYCEILPDPKVLSWLVYFLYLLWTLSGDFQPRKKNSQASLRNQSTRSAWLPFLSILLFDTNLEITHTMNLVDHYSTLFLFTVIVTGILAFLIRLLYEGYDSRAHIRALKSRGIVSLLHEHIVSSLDWLDYCSLSQSLIQWFLGILVCSMTFVRSFLLMRIIRTFKCIWCGIGWNTFRTNWIVHQ